MKQTIRFQTFETNSSSYHTLSIYRNSTRPAPKQIVRGQDLVIDTRIPYKTIGDTSSYSFVGIGSYTKAQMVLRFMGYKLEDQINDLVNEEEEYTDENDHWNWDKKSELEKEKFYDAPLIQAFVKAIKKFIGNDQKVIIEFNQRSCPFIDQVSDDGEYTYNLFNVNESDLENVDIMADKFYDIIFDDDIEMSEECESNE